MPGKPPNIDKPFSKKSIRKRAARQFQIRKWFRALGIGGKHGVPMPKPTETHISTRSDLDAAVKHAVRENRAFNRQQPKQLHRATSPKKIRRRLQRAEKAASRRAQAARN